MSKAPSPNITIVTREALYERVWTTPVSQLAEAFGTNGSWLKKLCVEAGIPLPGTGYWSKARAGKGVAPPPLPLRPPGASPIVTIGHYRGWWENEREMLGDPEPVEPMFPEPVETIVAQAMIRSGTLKPRPRSSSPAHRQRDFLEALRSALRPVSAELRIAARPPREMHVRFGAINVPFTLEQHTDGRLYLELPEQRDEISPSLFWDDPSHPLEGQLSEIIASMMTAAEIAGRAAAMRHYERCVDRLARARENARQHAAQMRYQREQRRIERAQQEKELLLSQADDWRTAHDIRGFVADVLKHVETEGLQQELAPWTEWALHQADLIDPVAQGVLRARRFQQKKRR